MSAILNNRFGMPDDHGKWAALALSVTMHALLLAALLLAVRWQTREVPLQAELWRSIPQDLQSAPPPAAKAPEPAVEKAPEPTPDKPPAASAPPPQPKPAAQSEPPRKAPAPPDIAVAKQKPPAKAPPPKAAEAPAKAPAAPDFAEQLTAAEDEATRRRETLEKIAKADAEARALESSRSQAAASARALAEADYAALIRNKIRGNIVLPPRLEGNPEAVFEVVQLPDGEVMSVRLSRSSGNPALDEAIERAILKSSPLPRPKLPELFRRELRLKYRPFEQ